MLAELAAFNVAFATIKKTVSAGQDIHRLAKTIGNMIGAEEALKEKNQRQKSSVFSKALGKEASDFESFMALEEIKQKREELRSLCRLYGRSGLWDDFVRYETDARKMRREAEEEHKRDMEQLKENVLYGVILFVVVGGVAGLIWWALMLKGLI